MSKLPYRRPNRGWFRPGHDVRRHPLTYEERARGGVNAWKRWGYWQGEPAVSIGRLSAAAADRQILEGFFGGEAT